MNWFRRVRVAPPRPWPKSAGEPANARQAPRWWSLPHGPGPWGRNAVDLPRLSFQSRFVEPVLRFRTAETVSVEHGMAV